MNKPMNINPQDYTDYQEATSFYVHAGEYNAAELSYLALGLAGEAGEFADAFKKVIRITGLRNDKAFEEVMHQGNARDLLIKELGDVLWYLNKCATFLGINMEQLMIDNTAKLHDRWGEGQGVKWPFEEYIDFGIARQWAGLPGRPGHHEPQGGK